MECAVCIYNFVQMIAEPGKAVATIVNFCMPLKLLYQFHCNFFVIIFVVVVKLDIEHRAL